MGNIIAEWYATDAEREAARAAVAPGTPALVGIRQYADGWIKKYVLEYELPDGSPYVYDCASRKGLEALRHALQANAACQANTPDAVCVVPRTPDDQLVMIREFRYPLNSWCIAFPAGLVEPGENLADCVDRELREETGYALRVPEGGSLEDAMRPMAQAGFSSTGLTDETVHIVFADVDRVADARPEPGELIEPFLLPVADARRFLNENRTPIGTRAQLVLEALAQAEEARE